MSEPNNNLSPDDRRLLAREAATDSYHPVGFVYNDDQIRETFRAGWDAALEWAGQRASEGIAHLDSDDECCHFQD